MEFERFYRLWRERIIHFFMWTHFVNAEQVNHYLFFISFLYTLLSAAYGNIKSWYLILIKVSEKFSILLDKICLLVEEINQMIFHSNVDKMFLLLWNWLIRLDKRDKIECFAGTSWSRVGDESEVFMARNKINEFWESFCCCCNVQMTSSKFHFLQDSPLQMMKLKNELKSGLNLMDLFLELKHRLKGWKNSDVGTKLRNSDVVTK